MTYFTGYEYDARNQLSALTDPLGQTAYYERDALGRERAKALPNGVTTYHQYDAASQVTDIVHAGAGEVLQSLGYTYDPDGQRTMIAREDGTRIYYRYDETHRLAGLRVRPGGQTDAEEARLVGCHQASLTQSHVDRSKYCAAGRETLSIRHDGMILQVTWQIRRFLARLFDRRLQLLPEDSAFMSLLRQPSAVRVAVGRGGDVEVLPGQLAGCVR